MQDFIVLGLIPGTNIQIGFLGWLTVAAVLLIIKTTHRHTSRAKARRFLNKEMSLVLAVQRIPRSATRAH